MNPLTRNPSILILTLFILPVLSARDREYTVQIPAGERSCFYHPVERENNILKEFELEFQVIEGGELDVNVIVQSPSGAVLFSVQRKSDGIHKIKSSEAGDHQICFDNGFSRITNKMVFFALIEDYRGMSEEEWQKFGTEEMNLDMKVEDIRTSVENVRHHLERSVQIQNMLRVHEARDRNLQEANCLRVTVWSCVQLVVMIGVAVLQIFLIRSLFEEKSRFNRLLTGNTPRS